MKINRRSFLSIAGVSACGCAFAADAYPDRPIRLIVPYASGASIDFAGRTIGARLGHELGQPVVIDNVTGAGGLIGTGAVSRATADGYTLGVGVGTTTTIAMALGKKIAYDPLKDLVPIGIATKNLLCIVVRPDFPAQTLKDLVDYARANPGKLSYGTAGSGTANHLEGERLNQFAKIQMVHVPYRGAAPAMADVLAGQIPVGILSVTAVVSNAKAGKLRMLAVLDDKPYGEMPKVPTASQALPGYSQDVASWIGIVAPAGLPSARVVQLNAALVRALKDPATQKALEANGMPVVAGSPQEFAAQLRREAAVWSRVVRDGNITVE